MSVVRHKLRSYIGEYVCFCVSPLPLVCDSIFTDGGYQLVLPCTGAEKKKEKRHYDDYDTDYGTPHPSLAELLRQSIMRNLVRRYVTVEQRKAESQGVTEDDVNEIKQDISAFRCELIEILKNSGMNTATASGVAGGAGGKKNRQKERRLMKGFNIAPPPAAASSPHAGQPCAAAAAAVELIASLQDAANAAKKSPPGGSVNTRLTRLARLAGAAGAVPKRESSKRRWGTLIEAARSGRVRRLMGRSRSQDSMCSGSTLRRGAVAERGDSRDDDYDEDEELDDEELEDEEGSSCSGSLREESEEVREPSPQHHGSLSALSAAWGGGMRLVRSLRKKDRSSSGRNTAIQPPLRLRLLHQHGSSSTESAPGSSNNSRVIRNKREKRLTRAASVPTRPDQPPEVVPTSSTLRDPGDGNSSVPISPPDLPPLELVPPPPFPMESSPTSPSQQQQLLKSRNGSVVLPNLPGIQPIGGHHMSAGWL